jgi:transcriptional regulator with XRE-family HTH domain
MGIAENLLRLRKRARLSQTKLAAKADVSQQLISQIERDENVTTKKLPELAKALGVSVFEIDPNFSPDDLPADAKASELVAIYRRLEDAPHLQALLLDHARLLASHVQTPEGHPEPEATDDR